MDADLFLGWWGRAGRQSALDLVVTPGADSDHVAGAISGRSGEAVKFRLHARVPAHLAREPRQQTSDLVASVPTAVGAVLSACYQRLVVVAAVVLRPVRIGAVFNAAKPHGVILPMFDFTRPTSRGVCKGAPSFYGPAAVHAARPGGFNEDRSTGATPVSRCPDLNTTVRTLAPGAAFTRFATATSNRAPRFGAVADRASVVHSRRSGIGAVRHSGSYQVGGAMIPHRVMKGYSDRH